VKNFTDANGRDWSISITIAQVKKLRDKCDVDLVADNLGETLTQIGNDPVALCDCIYTLCEDQIEKAGLSPEQFGEALAGDSIDDATDAFLDALVEFTPKKKRAILRGVLTKLYEAEDRAISAAMTYLESDEFESDLKNALTFGEKSTNSPALSASTPDP